MIRSFDSFSFDEEATKYRIILPILEKLGWNIYDLNQVYPEYPVRYKNEKVDYLLRDYNSTKILIEAKKPNQILDDHNCQLVKYCAAQNVHLGVLTNVINWRFYNIDFVDNSLGAIKNIRKEETNLLRDKPERIAEKLTDVFWGGNITRKKVSGYNKPNIKDIVTKVKSIKRTHLGFYNEAAVKQVIIMP
jgi:predicted type IV restriction endonuclease